MAIEELLNEMRTTLRGLDSVRVTKEDLIKIIEENRKEHRTIFLEAIDNWYKQVNERLQEMVQKAKGGPEHVILAVGLPKPEDHTKDYDRVLKMLHMSQDDEFDLDEREFAQYVMDDWGWQRAFLTTSSSYSVAATEKMNRLS